MPEDIGTIINKGFKTWVRNLKISTPFVLNSIVGGMLSFFFFALIGLLLLGPEFESGVDPTLLPPEQLFSIMGAEVLENISTVLLLGLIFYLLVTFVQAFFTAGAIGMAKKAAETGDAVLSDMVSAGKKNAFRLFLVSVLIALLSLVGIVFVVPGALAVGDLSLFLDNPEASLRGAGLLSFGILVWVLYLLIINLSLSLVGYALVVDELDPIEAIITGLRVFMGNKLDVIILWVLSLALSFVGSYTQEFIGPDSGFVLILTTIFSLIVIAPLTAIWWTRLYLTKTCRNLYDHTELLCDPNEFMNNNRGF